jgi:hypothetical protein
VLTAWSLLSQSRSKESLEREQKPPRSNRARATEASGLSKSKAMRVRWRIVGVRRLDEGIREVVVQGGGVDLFK